MIKEKQKLTELGAQLLTGARIRNVSHENKLHTFPGHKPLGGILSLTGWVAEPIGITQTENPKARSPRGK